MDLNKINQSFKRYGVVNTLEDLVTKGVNKHVLFRMLKGIKIEKVDPRFLEADERYQGGFLSRETLLKYVGDEYELSAAFLETAFAKGDECYGFLDGDMLAAYGWYSNKPTTIDVPGLTLCFRLDYIYMYKGFTHPKHRGKRLHAVGMTCALDAYLQRGHRGIISYVEHNNFDSLRSCYRMGYHDIGNIYLAGLPGHFFFFSDPSCHPYGFRLEQVAKER